MRINHLDRIYIQCFLFNIYFNLNKKFYLHIDEN